MGLFYVNTLKNIREFDNGAIGDNTEGVVLNRVENLKIPNTSVPEAAQVIHELSLRGIKLGPGINVTFENVSFLQHSNAYIYCVTKERNDAYWASIPKEQGGPYNCCIEIDDFCEFTKYMAIALSHQYPATRFFIGECFFEENTGKLTDSSLKRLDPFRKPDKLMYRHQKEIRAVFFNPFVPIQDPKLVWMPATQLLRFF